MTFKWWKQTYVWHAIVFCILFFGGLMTLWLDFWVGVTMIACSFVSMGFLFYTIDKEDGKQGEKQDE